MGHTALDFKYKSSERIVLMVHAFLGCDTVSQVYGADKDKLLKSDKLMDLCRNASGAFYTMSSTKVEVVAPRENHYLGYITERVVYLNQLRYKIFMQKHSGKPAISLSICHQQQVLQHVYCVYHQIET